ncbi:MAG: hypothetical protein M3Q33_11075, partial [Acidobacteriota bacterium]|nr:hypothetical protein [Acidobacteriota bacterium]
MENRRQTIPSTSKAFERKPYYTKDGERPQGDRKFQPREGDRKFQPRDSRFQPRGDRFQGKDERPPRRSGTFQPRNDRVQPKTRFAPKGKILKPWEKENRPRIVSDMQVTDGKHRGKHLQSTTS